MGGVRPTNQRLNKGYLEGNAASTTSKVLKTLYSLTVGPIVSAALHAIDWVAVKPSLFILNVFTADKLTQAFFKTVVPEVWVEAISGLWGDLLKNADSLGYYAYTGTAKTTVYVQDAIGDRYSEINTEPSPWVTPVSHSFLGSSDRSRKEYEEEIMDGDIAIDSEPSPEPSPIGHEFIGRAHSKSKAHTESLLRKREADKAAEAELVRM